LPVVREYVSDSGGKTGVFDGDGQVLVKNTDPAESQLERVSEEEFRLVFGLPARERDALLGEMAATLELPAGAERANESWHWAIWLLFALLTAEVLLASRVHA
jgi:hypothetical protein